jgi:hypothetical protein
MVSRQRLAEHCITCGMVRAIAPTFCFCALPSARRYQHQVLTQQEQASLGDRHSTCRWSSGVVSPQRCMGQPPAELDSGWFQAGRQLLPCGAAAATWAAVNDLACDSQQGGQRCPRTALLGTLLKGLTAPEAQAASSSPQVSGAAAWS